VSAAVAIEVRAGALAPTTANDAERTVDVTFSTGAAVRRGTGSASFIEELSMIPAHVRMGRLQGGSAPLLNAHAQGSVDDVVGVVVAASVNGNEGRATVRFSRRDDVEPLWKDVQDGIVRNVSVGYRVHRFEDVSSRVDIQAGVRRMRAVDWEPYEISLVPVGADPGATTRAGEGEAAACDPTLSQRALITEEKGGRVPNFQQTNGRQSAGRVQVHDNREDAPFRSLGEQLQAVVRSMTPGNDVDPRLQSMRAATGLNEGVGADGGFAVGKDASAEIWQRACDEGEVLGRVNRIPVGPTSNGINHPFVKEQAARTAGNRYGGIQVYRRAEAGTVNATLPALAEFKLELESGFAILPVTGELMSDAVQLDSLAYNVVPRAIAFKIEDEIINGSGAGQCLGVRNASALIPVPKEPGQLPATIVAENINKMFARLWAPCRRKAAWFINQNTETQLETMTTGTSGAGPVYTQPGSVVDSPYGRLKGRPVIPIEHCPTLGTLGDIILADMSQYALIEKGGVDAVASLHVRYIVGEHVLRFGFRNIGAPGYSWSVGPLTPTNGTDTLSAFVALQAR
jgi:HK97 family phage major capsid protein